MEKLGVGGGGVGLRGSGGGLEFDGLEGAGGEGDFADFGGAEEAGTGGDGAGEELFVEDGAINLVAGAGFAALVEGGGVIVF